MILLQILNIIQTAAKIKINAGFWVSMGISLFVAILMIIVFWSLPPKKKK